MDEVDGIPVPTGIRQQLGDQQYLELADVTDDELEEGEVEGSGRVVTDEEYQDLLSGVAADDPALNQMVDSKVEVFPWEGNTESARYVSIPHTSKHLKTNKNIKLQQ